MLLWRGKHLYPVLFQNAGTKRIQESSVHCRQQLLDVEAGDGSLQVAGNHAQMIYMMQSTLKETSRKICSLSKEKQQLIEIVNRLRAELGAASKKGKLIGQKNFGFNMRIKQQLGATT